MIQKDYIMRMIAQLTKFLVKILLNKNAGNHEEALANIESAFGNILGLDSKLLDALSAEDIAELLGISKDKSTGSMKCIVAARLLKEKAEVLNYTEKDDSVALSYFQKALNLYLQGMLNIGFTELDMISYYTDVKQLADTLGSSISDDLMFKMFSLYRSLESYDKAEDWLFRLKDAGYPDILKIGTEFFKELAKVDEVKLHKSDMAREEIEKGLAAFLNGN